MFKEMFGGRNKPPKKEEVVADTQQWLQQDQPPSDPELLADERATKDVGKEWLARG